MKNSTQLQRFLITYIATDDFNEIMKEEKPSIQESLQYVKFIAPSLDEVGNMLASRFSDVQVIGVAAEADFILSMEKLKNATPEQIVYVVARTEVNGNTVTDIVMDNIGLTKEEIISTLTVEEFTKAFSIPLEYLQSEDTPTLHYSQD